MGGGVNSPSRRRALAVAGYVLAVGGGVAVGAEGSNLARPKPKPPVEETRFLNFDELSTPRERLVSGWSGYEHDSHKDSFIWCAARDCTLLVSLHGQHDRRVSLRVWPFAYAGAPPQSITAHVNGAVISALDLKGDPVVWQFDVDKLSWREGNNVLRFDFNYAEAPAAHIPGSNDQRTLAAGFDWLEIEPLPQR